MIRYSLLCFILLGLQHQGWMLSTGDLTPQHSPDVIQRTKSAEMFKYMNLTANPCEDFYQYACGNFAKHNPVTEDSPAIGIGEVLSEKMNERVRGELETDYPSDTKAYRNVKNFFKSCLKIQHSLDKEYNQDLKNVVEQFGEMPLLVGESWNEHDFDWIKTLSKMAYTSGQELLLHIVVLPDFSDNTINRVVLGEPRLPMQNPEIYTGEAFADDRERIIEYSTYYLQNYFGVSEHEATQIAWEILNFEISLAHGMDDPKAGHQPAELFTLMDIDELQRNYRDMGDLKQLIYDTMDNRSIREVYVQVGYLDHVRDVLKKTPKRILANYLYFSYMVEYLVEPKTKDSEVVEYCIEKSKSYLYKVMDNMVYRKYIPKNAEQILYQIWRELKTAFQDILYSPRLDWIRQDTKKEAIQKLKHMKLKILSYEHPKDVEEVEQLDLSDQNFVENIDAIRRVKGNKARAKLNEPPQAMQMGAESSTTPYYNPFENMVYMPVAFLQPYYAWSTDFPSAYNFAFLGFFVSHELVHGFDNSGRNYDAIGNARNWWDSNTDQIFRERSKCFQNQYKELVYFGHHLPEMPSQAENIADGGGIRLAYEAYVNWYRKHTQSEELLKFPDLQNYNYKQLFFVSYAQVWCSNYAEMYIANQLADTHTPNQLRDIGPLANFDEFAKAFNCPMDTYMNPTTKCMIY
ncbi:neprilysin-1-like [Musca vetustissima]|uniref:neprilysin-1-like n=1 Tax=Musca vetustissima TaxID=27455 RepID=UPI002AB69770|nr:neprilysin-1-like [Musca vetustissima]